MRRFVVCILFRKRRGKGWGTQRDDGWMREKCGMDGGACEALKKENNLDQRRLVER
jgi:hypothetical protein